MDRFITRKKRENPNAAALGSQAPYSEVPKENIDVEDTTNLLDNVDRVKFFFGMAKELEAVEPEIQQVYFPEDATLDDCLLIELDKDLADRFETNGTLVIRGNPDDETYICTENRTYRLKEAEISNSWILTENLQLATRENDGDVRLKLRPITSVHHTYLEATEVQHVSLYRLRELLREDEIAWGEPIESTSKRHNLDFFLDYIQMSEQQLLEALDQQPVLEVEGIYRWLSLRYRDQLVDKITTLCDDSEAPDVSVEAVTFEALRSHLDASICDQAIRWFLKDQCKSLPDFEGHYALEERQICRSKASQILRMTTQLQLAHFEIAMSRAMPISLNLKYEYLRGLALVTETLAAGKTIRYLPVEDLPEKMSDRFALLFNIQSPWKYSHIEPYLDDVASSSKAKGQILLKFCRRAAEGGEDTYYPVER
ncbi:hypothetical protein L596_016707 [Steinernema carpocapsae]|uniref:Sister chromatid cohesion protein DCC1 n=1 Tax=Steinernema carpocapsae TaxID=34508 RepID=A0A4U5NJM4_STECR|nr:hypothetical protein L596_016707 [Steinernema carpocapsae]